MRKIQLKYTLEPAGSHGVWGLDDHHFLPFLFGGAELINHDVVKTPNDIHNESYLDAFSDDFMYMSKHPTPIKPLLIFSRLCQIHQNSQKLSSLP